MLVLFLFILSFFYSRVFGSNLTRILADSPPDGAGFTGLHFASHGGYGCQNRNDIISGLQSLDQNLNIASVLATAAANALLTTGVERSPAFIRWFGAGNAGSAETIRVNNYLSVVNWLQFPTTQVDFYPERIYENGPFSTFEILKSSLVYVCGVNTRYPCETRPDGSNVIAASSGQMTSSALAKFDATVLFLCPRFFQLGTFYELGTAWLSNPQTWSIDGGSTILHEAQHMIQLTGPLHLAIDVPTGIPGGCYHIDVCASLPDNLKIVNAQNFVFFALDAHFKPNLVYPPSDSSSQSESDDSILMANDAIPKSSSSTLISKSVSSNSGSFQSGSSKPTSSNSTSSKPISPRSTLSKSTFSKSTLSRSNSSSITSSPSRSQVRSTSPSLYTFSNSASLSSPSSSSSSSALPSLPSSSSSSSSSALPSSPSSSSSSSLSASLSESGLPSSSTTTPSFTSAAPSSQSSFSSSTVTSTTAHQITLLPVPITETISKHSTYYVGIGVIVIGGDGGGTYVAGGSTYSITAGETETAGSGDNPPITVTLTETTTTSTSTSSGSTSSCTAGSASACSVIAQGPVFLDENLNGLNDQQIIAIMGPTDYTPVSTSTSTSSPLTTSHTTPKSTFATTTTTTSTTTTSTTTTSTTTTSTTTTSTTTTSIGPPAAGTLPVAQLFCPGSEDQTMGPYICPGGSLSMSSFEPSAIGYNPTALPTMGMLVDNECSVTVLWTIGFNLEDSGTEPSTFTVDPSSQQTATYVNALNCDWGASPLD